jgi:hypothetical protein
MPFCIVHSAFRFLLLVRQHPGELWGVDISHRRRPAQASLPLRRLAAQNMLLEGFASQKLPALGPFEALGGATMGFEFRH